MKTTIGSTQRSRLGATGRRATIEGIELAWDDEGDGPPLVCLHAIGHGASDFTRLRERLRDRHRVVALDWPGQGNSGDDTAAPSAARYAHILGAFLDHTKIERAVLLGNSIGGAAALIHAAARPEQVQALVIENSGGLAPVDDRAARVALAAMARFFAAGARRARWFPRAFAAYYRFCVLPSASARAQRQRIAATAFEIAPLLEQAWRGFADASSDLRPLIPRIAAPVLFAWGKRDPFVALARSRAAIDGFAHGRLEAFAVTHAPHLEAPEAFETSFERYLDEVGWRRPQPSAMGDVIAAV